MEKIPFFNPLSGKKLRCEHEKLSSNQHGYTWKSSTFQDVAQMASWLENGKLWLDLKGRRVN